MEILADPQVWLAFATLTALEIVLGIDNIIFISIVSNKLPPAQQPKARNIGLLLAMVLRVLVSTSTGAIFLISQTLSKIKYS